MQERTSPKRESSSSLYDRVRSKLSRSISSYSSSNTSSNTSSNSRSQFTSPLLHLAEADQNAGYGRLGFDCRNNPRKLAKFSRYAVTKMLIQAYIEMLCSSDTGPTTPYRIAYRYLVGTRFLMFSLIFMKLLPLFKIAIYTRLYQRTRWRLEFGFYVHVFAPKFGYL